MPVPSPKYSKLRITRCSETTADGETIEKDLAMWLLFDASEGKALVRGTAKPVIERIKHGLKKNEFFDKSRVTYVYATYGEPIETVVTIEDLMAHLKQTDQLTRFARKMYHNDNAEA